MRWAIWFAILTATLQAAPDKSVRGRLVQHEGRPPAIETADHKLVNVAGDTESLAVLNDSRLAGADLELHGNLSTPDRFQIGPFYTSKSIIVHKDGKRYTVSYWCPVCSIRSYTPGNCVCCQRETDLDLEELK